MIKNICPECNRVFDMFNDLDVEEWSFGHDCEVQIMIAIGNFEPCPYCVKEGNPTPYIHKPQKDIIKHFEKAHAKQFYKDLGF